MSLGAIQAAIVTSQAASVRQSWYRSPGARMRDGRDLDRTPFAPGAPRRVRCVVGRSLCRAGALCARAAIAPVPKKDDRFF